MSDEPYTGGDLARRLNELVERVRGLERSVNGNGKVGISELVRAQVAQGSRMEQSLTAVKEKVEILMEDRVRADAMRQGSDRKLGQVQRWVTIVGAALLAIETGGVQALMNLLKALVAP